MVRELIDYVIKAESGISITYSKDGAKSNIFHLNHVSYSPKYGKDYIVGYCYEYDSELTFKVERITNAELEWMDMMGNNPYRPHYMHLMVYLADNYFGYELRQYEQCEWTVHLIKSLQQDDVFAIHYIPYLDADSSSKWITFNNDDKILHRGVYTFAYKVIDRERVKEDEESISDIEWTKAIEQGTIRYGLALIHSNKSINELNYPKNLELMAYHYTTFYNQKDHKIRWELAKKMGLI